MWRDNDVKHSSKEVSFSEHPALITNITNHQTVVLFKKESMYAEKPITVENIPPLKFVVCITIQFITDIIQVSWKPERYIAVIFKFGAPVEEAQF